jgi:serine/threonine-protein kinase
MESKPTLSIGADPAAASPVDTGSETMAALEAPGAARVTLQPTSRLSTVLPEVRTDSGQLELVPRDAARYENQGLLGRGGMGEVKLAEDQDIGRKVAIKRMLGDASPHSVARFVDEVRTVGRLEHPNIVPIHDVGVDADGALFFVMKYVDGETLGSIIERLRKGEPEAHRRYTYEARLDLFTSLCRALQYAHSRGLVHRDVKPDNIMVGRYGEVILMDWGIAHRMREEVGTLPRESRELPERAAGETVDGSVIGTPQYMSPEQARGEVATLDGRSDLYSAFMVLYELLTLRPYLDPEVSALQMVCAAAERCPPDVYDAGYWHPAQAEAVPVELRHFLKHGLAPEVGERFADAEELIYSLEALRAGDFAVQCPITFMKQGNTKMERFMDNHPGGSIALAVTTAIAILGGLAGWAAWLWVLGS